MDNSVYRQLLSKIKKSNAIPHHNFPNHNLLSVENLVEVSVNLNSNILEDDTRLLSSFPCYQQFPYAVSRSSPCFCGSGVVNEAHKLVKAKLKWQKDLKNLKLYNIDKAIKQIKDLRQNKGVKISKNLKKYVEHFSSDPEPMFYGNYNWLYSCGTLSYIETLDGPVLISADNIGRKPGFHILKLNDNLDKIHNKSSCSLKNYSPVLQTTCKSNQDNLILCIRQKHHLNLYDFGKTDRLSQPVKLWRKKVKSPKLITCVDIKSNCKEVFLSDSNHDLHVFDIERRDKIYGCAGRKIFPDLIRDPWSQVAFGCHGLYVTFRNCFVILDPRDLCSMTFKYFPSPAVNNCEDICSFVKSSCDSNFMYLGLTHSILQLDVRNGETVQKWTHLMKKPPQFLSSTMDLQENEILMLQSQTVGEVVAIANELVKHGDRVNFLSRSLPCLMSSIKESLMVARFHGVCLSPFLAERIDFSITGMHCVKNSAGDINIFTNNSGGDVFLSKMQRAQTIDLAGGEDELVEVMKIYESHLQRLPLCEPSTNPLLELTDMSHVLRDVRNSKSRAKNVKKPEIGWRYHEMYSPESLNFCKDFLARKILNVWGYGEKDSDVKSVVSVEEKVREWMDMNEGTKEVKVEHFWKEYEGLLPVALNVLPWHQMT